MLPAAWFGSFGWSVGSNAGLRVRETVVDAETYGSPPTPTSAAPDGTAGTAGPVVAARPGPTAEDAEAAGTAEDAEFLDPFDDMDSLEELGDEIATLAAHIHAATQRMLALLADFDRRRGWEIGGHRTCAHWLAYRTGLDLGAARERVRTARKLEGLPRTRAVMARGELSFSQVRALSRVATPDNEAELLALARGATTAQLEQVVRGWKRGSRKDEAAWERERHERRTFSVFPDEDGMYRVNGRLEPEVGALLMRAIEAASDSLYREASTGTPIADRDASHKAAAQRRADAIGLLAERGMAAGFEAGRISGTRAERYQVVLHVDEATLEDDPEHVSAETWKGGAGSTMRGGQPDAAVPLDRSHLEDGTRVSAETSRRIACDAGLVKITHEGNGAGRASAILDVGRRTRTIPPALRRALEARDHGCRFPGCGLRFTDGHHVKHWADGGETSLGNTLLLCRHHHRLVHEGGWRVRWWGPGRPVFIDPRGGTHFDGRWNAPEPAKSGTPDGEPADPGVSATSADALIRRNRHLGVDPDDRTAGARWKRLADIPDEIIYRAMEALG